MNKLDYSTFLLHPEMQVFSWPHPPKPNGNTPPSIPSKYTSFGVTYDVIDGVPMSSSSGSTGFDKDRFKNLLNLSFATFMELMAYPSEHEGLVTKISDIHSEINQLLNSAKRVEARYELERIKNDHIENKNRIASEIKRAMSDFKMG